MSEDGPNRLLAQLSQTNSLLYGGLHEVASKHPALPTGVRSMDVAR
jgi:hypothetical protein